MYQPHQVTDMLDIPPSTLRRLSVEFAALLSKTPGRHRRYSERDIDTLRRIRAMTGQGMTLATIHEQLTIVETPPAAPPAENTLAIIPSIAAEFTRLDNYSQSVGRELEALRASWKVDHERLERFAEWAALPWWKRLFTPPPK